MLEAIKVLQMELDEKNDTIAVKDKHIQDIQERLDKCKEAIQFCLPLMQAASLTGRMHGESTGKGQMQIKLEEALEAIESTNSK